MHLFIPAIWMAAGFSLFAGVHFLITGAWRRREPGFLAFGLLCLLIAAYMVLTAALYETDAATTAGQIARLKVAIMCVTYPVAVWFLCEFTDVRNRRLWLIAACLVFGDLFILNSFSPNSLLYSNVERTVPLVFPWGESLNNFATQPSYPAYAYFASAYAFFIWAFWRCAVTWQSGLRNKAWPLTLYL
ncbi:MAG: hypothetical protein ACRETQ_04000, partial [Gammaproteobacteria bacterium]